MTRPDLRRPWRLLPLSTALTSAALAFAALPALAQGTDAQREACAPDAVKLCPDTIPDVERTKACMQRQEARLSPACRAVFSDAIGGTPGRDRRRATRQPGPPNDGERAEARPRRERPDAYDQRAAREAPAGDEDDFARRRRSRDPGDDDEADGRERVPPAYAPPGVREYRYLTPDGEEARAPDTGESERARDEVSRLCEEGQMDPDTCATTDPALGR